MLTRQNGMSSQSHYNAETEVTRPELYWTAVIVKWTRQECSTVYMFPDAARGHELGVIYRGDSLEVSRDYQANGYFLCRRGHSMGWIYAQDVKFIRSAPHISPTPMAKMAMPSSEVRQEAPVAELATYETVPNSIPQRVTAPPPAQRSMVEKLVSFFKK